VELDPKRLLVLHAIAEANGIAAAARVLGHTPSAVSQQLQRLEREAGVALVDRSSGRLELTEAGRLLADSGQAIERALATAVERLGGMGNRVQGPVRIGISAWGMAEIALPTVRVLGQIQPLVQPVIVEADQFDGLDALRRGTLDVLILSDDRDTAVELPPGVTAQALVEDDYRLVLPRDWPVPESPKDLHDRPWIVGPEYSAGGRAFARFAALHGIVPSVRHQARQPSAVQALVAGGLGAALLPMFVAARLREAVAGPFPVPGRYIIRVLMRAGPGGPSPAVRAALRAIRQAGLDSTERYAATGLAPREPIVTDRVLDPSERPRAGAGPGRRSSPDLV
jgi:DNA-binding transcriptional LysR family regulator